ncbi:hypothetical protein [Microbacterium sp. No. 7]|uniref:hypothetical protein n=1 Tax=Microbacterium sp. No. 7 TaxID=1714373 RepID=UPI0006D0ACD6|nr:hypothetical protein [Microbacterium sp. No. 7]ALJ19995.1 hypothetical protein AOA12_08770 [Microbacterium sp. No. 7]
MAAHVLRLRTALLGGALQAAARELISGGRRRRIAIVVALAATVLAVLAVAAGILALGDADAPVARTAVVLGGAVVLLGCVAVPLLTGTEDVLDPRRFAVVGLDARAIAGPLALAAPVGATGIVLLALSACLVTLWTAQGVSPLASVPAAVLGAATCLLTVRVSQAAGALLLRPRRARTLTGALVVAPAVVLLVAVFAVARPWRDAVPPSVAAIADVLAVTPLGAVWALPAVGAEGGTPWSVVVALATSAALAVAWVWLVGRVIASVGRPRATRMRAGLGWFAVLPSTATGAIAARSLVYWFGDVRYVTNLVMVPVAAVLTAVPLVLVGVGLPTAALLSVSMMALLFGWLAHNDLAYDATALWMHVSARVAGLADRVGRLVPVVLVAVPLLAVTVPAAVWLQGSWALLPVVAGVCASLFLSGLGLSSVSSALLPYAVASPGDGPFQQPQRSRGTAGPAIVLFGALAVTAPTLWLAWRSLDDPESAGTSVLWAGVGTGLAVMVLGILSGAWAYRRRQRALLELAESQ